MAKALFTNNAVTTLAADITDSATSVTVPTGDGALFASPTGGDWQKVTITNGTDIEVIKVTARSSDTLTVTRGEDGTTAIAWTAGVAVSARLTAEELETFPQLDNGGDTKGSGAVNLQPSRSSSDQVASGDDAVAIGSSSKAPGARSIAIGGLYAEAPPGEKNIAIMVGLSDAGRTVERTLNLGNNSKYAAFTGARRIAGFEFVDHHDWWYTGSADSDETEYQTTQEHTIYSVPIQAGDETWQASTSYEHGHAVRPTTPNGYCYVAYYQPTYFDSGTSGGSEPTWPTTAGDSVSDNGIDWICVDPTDIQFILPDYARFTPTAVGVIARSCTPGGGPTQPEVSFGINGDLDKWLAATTLTKMTGDGASEFIDPTNTESAKQFGAELTTVGSDIDCTLVFALKGYVVEELSA